MKKIIMVILIALMSISPVSALSINLNGQALKMDAPPYVKNDRTMVPISTVAKELGAQIAWEPTTQTAEIIKDGKNIKIAIGSNEAIVGGSRVMLDVAAEIQNGRTMVPLRFVAESLGLRIEWEAATQTVLLGNKKEVRPTYKVVRVVDGDTIVISINGREEKVRMIGVDTPESVSPDETKNTESGLIASDYTKKALEGKMVGLEQDVTERDKFGRLLFYVYLGDVMFNEQLLRDGMALARRFPPDVKYAERFADLQKDAENRKVGIWANPSAFAKPLLQEAKKDQNTSAAGNGKIKGNINSKGEKIYHVPGMKLYDKTVIEPSKGERYFETEAEAEAAGFRRSQR